MAANLYKGEKRVQSAVSCMTLFLCPEVSIKYLTEDFNAKVNIISS